MTTAHRPGAASALVLTALLATLGAAQLIAPQWVKRVGLDFWNLAELRASRVQASKASETINEEGERLRHGIEITERLATQLMEGRTTLKRAVDELEPLMRERTGFACVCETAHNTTNLRVGTARHLMLHVKRLLSESPSQPRGVLERLEAECAALK
jgi:hypothetical protein